MKILNFSLILAALLLGVTPGRAQAADTTTGSSPPTDKASTPEEEDFSETPYTEYGDFNQTDEEDEETKFLQYGRLFGVSIGMGLETLDGKRGRLWQGGFPVIDFKLVYWFNFNLAVDFGLTFASHNYVTSNTLGGNVNVNLNRYGSNIKYYFDTRDLSAPITFINPLVELGISNYTKTETADSGNGIKDVDSSLGFDLGAGIEITLKPKAAYFQIEAKANFVNFKDTNSDKFKDANPGITDLKGRFYTLTGNLLFTW